MAQKSERPLFNYQPGMGVLGWLFIILFVLKLNPGGHLDSAVENYSWADVWAPLWVPLVVLLFFSVMAIVAYLVVKRRQAKAAQKRMEEARKRFLGMDDTGE